MNKYMYVFLLSFFCFLLNIKATCAVGHMCANQKEAIRMLGWESSFNFFPINLSEIEKDNLSKLKIDGKGRQIQQYIRPSEPLPNFSSVLEAFGNEHELSQSVAATLKKIVDDIVCASGKETAWVVISFSSVTNIYDIPRWHTDSYWRMNGGYPHPSHEVFFHKIVVSLKGPCTLLYDLPENDREHFNQISNIYAMETRQELVTLLNDSDRIHVPPLYAGTAFIIGDNDSAAVHSEPRMDSERIFISVVPMNQ